MHEETVTDEKMFSFRTHPTLYTDNGDEVNSLFYISCGRILDSTFHPVDDNRYLNCRTNRFPHSSLTSVLKLSYLFIDAESGSYILHELTPPP